MKERHRVRNLLFAGGFLIFSHGVYDGAQTNGQLMRDQQTAQSRHPMGTEQWVMEAEQKVEDAGDSLVERLEAEDEQVLVRSERQKYLHIANRHEPSNEKKLFIVGEIFGPVAAAGVYFSRRKKPRRFPRILE